MTDKELLLIKIAGLQQVFSPPISPNKRCAMMTERSNVVDCAFCSACCVFVGAKQKSSPIWDVASTSNECMDRRGPKRGQFVTGVPLFSDGCCRQTTDKCDFLRRHFQLAIACLLDVSFMINCSGLVCRN